MNEADDTLRAIAKTTVDSVVVPQMRSLMGMYGIPVAALVPTLRHMAAALVAWCDEQPTPERP